MLSKLAMPLGRLLATLRISPHFLSFSGIVFGSIAALAFVWHNWTLAVVFFALSGLSDVVDGMVARARGLPSPCGSFFDTDAKAVFQAKCASCHSVESEGIAAGNLHVVLNVDWKRLCKDCSADLSGVGERRRDAKWLKAYLKGEKKGRNGLRHNELPVRLNGDAFIMKDGPGQFSLTDAEGDALVNWLLTLRQVGTKLTASASQAGSTFSATTHTIGGGIHPAERAHVGGDRPHRSAAAEPALGEPEWPARGEYGMASTSGRCGHGAVVC